MYVSTKTQRVVDRGLEWKKLGSSWDPVYSIQILSKLQIILRFCETGCSLLFLIKNIRENQSEGEKNKRRKRKFSITC